MQLFMPMTLSRFGLSGHTSDINVYWIWIDILTEEPTGIYFLTLNSNTASWSFWLEGALY